MAKVGRRPKNQEPPKCACGCGQSVRWLPGRGWGTYVWGHHIKVNNPNKGEHMRGDRSPMKRPEVVAKLSGDNHWLKRPENVERAKEHLAKISECHKGSNNPGWKGGKTSTEEGYIRIRVGMKYVMEHRHVMEKHLGRKLLPIEVVHHKDGDIKNNVIDNLEVLAGQARHAALHNKIRQNMGLLDPKNAPLCLCGCGKKVNESVITPGIWKKYAYGHAGYSKDYDGRYLGILDPKCAPLCACGCGKRVKENTKKPGIWNTYLKNHRHKK